MLFACLSCVAGMAVKITTAEEDQVQEMVRDRPEIELVLDNNIGKDQYNIMLGGLSIDGTDKAGLGDLLSLSSALKEMPTEMSNIINELSVSKDDIVSSLKSGAYNFAVIFTDDPAVIKSLKGIEKVSHIKFFFSASKQEADSFGVPFPGALGYNSTDRNLMKLPFRGNLDALVSAITLPALAPITHDNMKYFQTLDQRLLYLIDKVGTYEKNRLNFEADAKTCSNFAKFIFFTPEDVPALIPLLKLEDKDYPVLVSLATEGKGIVKSLAAGSFTQAVQSLITMSAEKIIFSSTLPEDNDALPVKIVNTETLEKFTDAKDSDVLIAFTSPACQYCMRLRPELEKFGSLLSEKKVNIKVGDYNIMENEETARFTMTGVPSLFFIKKGTTTPIMIPANVRTTETLLKYISEEGVTSKIKVEDFAEEIKKDKEEKEKEDRDSDDEIDGPETRAGEEASDERRDVL